MTAGGFVPNDTYMNKESDRLGIITGPNMARKIYIYEASCINHSYGTDPEALYQQDMQK